MGLKLCQIDGCTKLAQRGGLCIKHGAKRKRKLCKIDGCTNQAKVGGVCITHGAKRKLCETVLLTFAGNDNADNTANIPNKKRKNPSIDNDDTKASALSAISDAVKATPTRYSGRLATLAAKRYAASGPGPIDDELKTPPPVPLQTTKAKDPITGSTDESTPSQSKAKIQTEPKDITAETVTRKSPPKYKESGPPMPQTVTRKAPPK